MSSTTPSRAPSTSSAITLADVILAIRNDNTLPLHRRQDFISACNTACRVLAQEPDAVPADPVLLRRRLAEANPRALGLRAPRWNNVRSLVGRAVRSVIPMSPGRRRNTLLPGWATLQGRLRAPFPRGRLSNLMRFASARGVPPDRINLSVFDAYRTDLLRSLRKNPELTYDAVCRAWNNAMTTVPDWPPLRVPVTVRRKTWTLPWTVFPASLPAEVQESLRRGEDLLADDLSDPLRPATIKRRDYQYRQAASALVCQGHDPASIRGLADLVSLDAFKTILRHLMQRRDGMPSDQAIAIAILLRSTARNRFNIPDKQLESMQAIIKRLEKAVSDGQSGMTARNRDRLMDFNDPATVRALLTLPETLMTDAAQTRAPCKAARLAQTALAIELLLMAPLRIGNLAALDLQRHIRRLADQRLAFITIEGNEVKNGVTLEYPLPPPTVALLDTYLRQYRDRLIIVPTTALFPGRDGPARARTGLATQISRTIKAYTGLTINVHLFRHLGAKLFLDAHPGGYEVVRLALGHKSLDTTTSFYTGTESISAIRHYHQAILKHRKK